MTERIPRTTICRNECSVSLKMPSRLGRTKVSGDKLTSTSDLVEKKHYLYVRVVKAMNLPANDAKRSSKFVAEIKLGQECITSLFQSNTNPEWNQVFAFSKDRIHTTVLEVTVKDKHSENDDIIGLVMFDLNEVLNRVPPESPLAPQWYKLEDRNRGNVQGELMLAVWNGTQADEAFSEAWHSDTANISGESCSNVRPKIYLTPKLWYLRVNVIEAQDLVLPENGRNAEVFAKIILGTQNLQTQISQRKSVNPMWNEDFILVAAEPFEDQLVISVQANLAHNKNEVLGKTVIPIQDVEKRLNHEPVHSRWYYLEKDTATKENKEKKTVKFTSRIQVRICLEGANHVLDEPMQCNSDFRPTAKQLWKPSIGVLELGILSAQGLFPMKNNDGQGTTDAYCVAKYGQKWVRTRTIANSLNPKWNEQYTWEVYDQCTVITIGVFDNCHLQGEKATDTKDTRIGRIRIRLSTLKTDQIYNHSYPLIALHPLGVRKHGEVQLAIRFNCSSFLDMMCLYYQPILPEMHYLLPLSMVQVDKLRSNAAEIVSKRLSRAEPPLPKEVVEYMLDIDANLWSMRKSYVNFYRIRHVLSPLVGVIECVDRARSWNNPFKTILMIFFFITFVLFPEAILPLLFVFYIVNGIRQYWSRTRDSPCTDTTLAYVIPKNPDELAEEFDTFPASSPPDVMKKRYDRLRLIAGRVQAIIGDLATEGERLQSLLNWYDTRASAIFALLFAIALIVLSVTPLKVLVFVIGIYLFRPPMLQRKLPSAPLNFFRRLPAQNEGML